MILPPSTYVNTPLQIEEEFEKLTSESDDLERILEVEMEAKRARIAAAAAGGSPVKRKPSPETSSAASSIPFAGTLFSAVVRLGIQL